MEYRVGGTAKTRALEDELRQDFQDLKAEIEENELVHNLQLAPHSTVSIPKDIDYFVNDRAHALKKQLEVGESHSLLIQAERMLKESNLDQEFTPENLPLIIHQFFQDRMRSLVQCKHSHMLRWRRFCVHSKAVEHLCPLYQKRLQLISQEYEDAAARARRLSVVQEYGAALCTSHLSTDPPTKLDTKTSAKAADGEQQQKTTFASTLPSYERALSAVSAEDLFIYLRWLVTNMRALKRFNQFYLMLEYYPLTKQTLVNADLPPAYQEPEDSDDFVEIDASSALQPRTDTASRRSSASSNTGRPNASSSNLQEARSLSSRTDRYSTMSTAQQQAVSSTSKAASITDGDQRTMSRQSRALESSSSSSPESFAQTCDSALSIPLHTNVFSNFRLLLTKLCSLYEISFDVQAVRTPGDEMELFGAACRRFKEVFTRQQEAMQFRLYGASSGNESEKFYGMDTWRHALKRECNWLPFINIHSESDSDQLATLTKLRSDNVLDEVIVALSHFSKISDVDRALVALRSHASTIYFVPDVSPVSVSSHRTQRNTLAIWKEIYTNPALTSDQTDSEKQELMRRTVAGEQEQTIEADVDRSQSRNGKQSSRAQSARSSRAPSAKQRKTSQRDMFDYFSTMQMLGLDDGEQNADGGTSIAGGFLTYLILRLLRIRDLQRTSLSILNYFRSIERTLTINERGLSHQAGKQKRKPTLSRDTPPGGAGLASVSGELASGGIASNRAHLYHTPADFAVSDEEFMQFQEIANHDDFWYFEDGRMHVQDSKGYFVMYDAALNDYANLESDLLLMASQFVRKDKRMRNVSRMQRDPTSSGRSARKADNGPDSSADFNIYEYSHFEVDRFGVLFDLWTLESEWLEAKLNLTDCYFEAYQHCFDREERRRLAQVITDVMHRRPRIDYRSSYFVKSYRLEITILRLQTQLVKSMLDKHIEEQRSHIDGLFESATKFGKPKASEAVNSAVVEGGYGLPYKTVKKQLISINSSRSMLKNVYLLEFHTTLGAVSRLNEALKYAASELSNHHKPSSVTASIMLEKRLIETALSDWHKLPNVGYSMASSIQKEVFSPSLIENPNFIHELVADVLADYDQKSARQTMKQRHPGLIRTLCRLAETLTLRNQLLYNAWQSELLSECYRKIAQEAGHEECHLFLRFVQLEFARRRDVPRLNQSVFVTALADDDSVDHYVPDFLSLAIHELDENHVGKVSFLDKETIMNLLISAGGFENLQTVVRTQIVHKNAVLSAILHHQVAKAFAKYRRDRGQVAQQVETRSEKSSFTFATGFSSSQNASVIADGKGGSPSKGGTARSQPVHVDSFVSIQLEKTPIRNQMINEFVAKKEGMALILKNPEELARLKRTLINEFCVGAANHFAQFNLRAQITAYYAQITNMIERFPGIRTHFMLGEAGDRRTPLDELDASSTPDPRSLRSRPRRVLSVNGKNFVNLWYIPTWIELVQLHRSLPIDDCMQALRLMCTIVGCLHDILAYLVAFAQLGCLKNQSIVATNCNDDKHRDVSITAEWGSAEGIEEVLREIQKQIDSLPKPDSPQMVADFLLLRRNTLFLEFDSCLRHSVSDLFLASGNDQAFQTVSCAASYGLRNLSNVARASICSRLFELPAPFTPHDSVSEMLFPMRTFLAQHGPFPTAHWGFKEIERNVKVCVAGLHNSEKRMANGELLRLRALLEDMLQNATLSNFVFGKLEELNDAPETSDKDKVSKCVIVPLVDVNASAQLTAPRFSGPLNFLTQPIDSLRLICWYLITWKRLEVFKRAWGKRTLVLEKIDNFIVYKEFMRLYRDKHYQPVLASAAAKYGQPDMYERALAEDDILPLPKGCTHFEVKVKELFRLVEEADCDLICEVKKRVTSEIHHVLAQRVRDEQPLPADLWKKPTVIDKYSSDQHTLVENFVLSIGGSLHTEANECTIDLQALNSSIMKLGTDLMARERENYENYSMFYEGLLAQQQSLLARREAQNRVFREQIRLLKHGNAVDVQFEMADRNYALLLEVTELRTKIAEMREYSLLQEREIREKVKNNYTKLVHDLFALAFDIRTQFDEFRDDLFTDVYDVVADTRKEAAEKMSAFKQKFNSLDEKLTKLQAQKGEELHQVQNDLYETHKVMLRTKTLQFWKQAFLKEDFKTQLSDLQRKCDRHKIEYTEVKLRAEEELELLRQQQVALQKLLSSLKIQFTEMQTQLDGLLKGKREHQVNEVQHSALRKQINKFRQDNVSRLLIEIEEKDEKLRELQEELDRRQKQREQNAHVLEQSIAETSQQLQHERSLKVKAFHQVEHFHRQLEEIDELVLSPTRINTAKTRVRSAVSGSMSIPRADRCKSAASSTSSFWPARGTWNQKAVTPGPDMLRKLGETNATLTVSAPSSSLRRPRTVSGKLRFADQPELEPSQEIIEEF